MSAIPCGDRPIRRLAGFDKGLLLPTDTRLILMKFLPLDTLQALASLCRRTIGSM